MAQDEHYHQKALALCAYCALQTKIISLYDPSYDDEAALREAGPISIKAIRKQRRRNLRALEELSDDLQSRMDNLKRGNPERTNSEESKELFILLEQRKKEYEELSNPRSS